MSSRLRACFGDWAIAIPGRFAARAIAVCSIFVLGAGFTTAPPRAPSEPPFASLVKPASIVGKDERGAVPEKYAKYTGSVGLLLMPAAKSSNKIYAKANDKVYMCTAFCVAEDVIATNAHCLVRRGRGQVKNLDQVKFIRRPDLKYDWTRALNSLSHLVVTSPDEPYLTFYTGFSRNAKTLRAFRNDWAFAKLRKPVCSGHELSFAKMNKKRLRRASRQGKIFIIGFHGDLDPSNGPYYSPNCRAQLRADGQSLRHYCDMKSGSSGSPLLWFDGENAKVVGINVGSYSWNKYRYKYNRRTGKRVGKIKIISRSKHNFATRPENFLRGIQAFQDATLLSSKHAFLQYQKLLKKAGYYKGRVDGLYGPATRAATKKFEKSLKMVPLGLPSQQLLFELHAQTDTPPTTQKPSD